MCKRECARGTQRHTKWDGEEFPSPHLEKPGTKSGSKSLAQANQQHSVPILGAHQECAAMHQELLAAPQMKFKYSCSLPGAALSGGHVHSPNAQEARTGSRNEMSGNVSGSDPKARPLLPINPFNFSPNKSVGKRNSLICTAMLSMFKQFPLRSMGTQSPGRKPRCCR